MRYIIIMALVVVSITGCYYDHANLVYPQATCTITTATYSANVTSILNANCYSCHAGNAAAGGGIKLDTYASLKTYVNNGQLMNSINQKGGIPAMPLNGSKLAACDINAIQIWINNGAINN